MLLEFEHFVKFVWELLIAAVINHFRPEFREVRRQIMQSFLQLVRIASFVDRYQVIQQNAEHAVLHLKTVARHVDPQSKIGARLCLHLLNQRLSQKLAHIQHFRIFQMDHMCAQLLKLLDH